MNRHCLRYHCVARRCGFCRQPQDAVHVPLGMMGRYCERCCPVCNPSPEPPRAA
jgi:hypothetical protein